MRVLAIVVFTTILLGWRSVSAQTAPASCAQPEPSLAANSAPNGTVRVDGDANVWVLGFGKSTKIGEDLRLKTIPKAALKLLSQSDIPILYEQLTCRTKGWTLVSFVTIHSIAAKQSAGPERELTVILVRDQRAEVLLHKIYPEIYRMVIADVNGDGVPELVVDWSDSSLISPGYWLDMWSIGAAGRVSAVNLTNIYKAMNQPFASHAGTVELGRYDTGDFSVYSEQRSAGNKGVTLRVRKQYTWDAKESRYQFRSVVKIEERVLTSDK